MFSMTERGYSEWMILLPGWGFDKKIFDTIDLPYNYLLCDRIKADTVPDLLSMLEQRKIDNVSILGFSQGAFTACEICENLGSRVSRVILAGARPFYPEDELNEFRIGFNADRQTFMNRFYRECFTRQDRSVFGWFRKNLLKDYLEDVSSPALSKGLDLLASSRININSLSDIRRVSFIHGQEDRIAPVGEIRDLVSGISNARLSVIENTGHLPFLHNDFPELINEV